MARAKTGQGLGGCWPTADHVLLLRAGLLGAEDAREAWARWRAANALETADAGAVRLLPLVYRNRLAAGIGDGDLGKLEGAYNATWLRNQLLFSRAAGALGALRDVGIQTMLLKGAALAVYHYRDAGARPMADTDVLVPWRDAPRALDVLGAAGWQAGPEGPPRWPRTVHALNLRRRDGGSLDLHRTALAQPAPDDDLWAGSLEIELLGVPTRTLCPADQLLHVVAHGFRWNLVPPVRWLADAVAIERSAEAGLDWDRFVAGAVRRRLTLRAAAGLEQLRDALELPVPDRVLARLRAAPKAPLERWVYRASTRPVGAGNWLPVVLDQYVRTARLDPSLGPRDFLKEVLRVSTGRELSARLAHKTLEAASGRAARSVAPSLLRQCPVCGRQLVRLRPRDPELCRVCSAAGAVRI